MFYTYFVGIYSVNVDFHQQKVIVWGICDKYDVLSAVKSKRKGARFWDSSEDTNNNIQLHESHSEPSSPDRSSSLSKNYSTRHLAMAKVRSLNLSLSMMMKNKALNWKGLKKVFIRSNSFWSIIYIYKCWNLNRVMCVYIYIFLGINGCNK